MRNSVVVSGSWISYGAVDAVGSGEIEGQLSSAGSVSVTGQLHVSHDLSVGGDLSGSGSLTVDGALRLGGQDQMSAPVRTASHGAYTAVTPPCPCGDQQRFDVAAQVAGAKAQNDNAAHAVPAALDGAAPVSLSSGRYYFSSARTLGAGQVKVDGAVAIYIDGSVESIGSDAIELAPGATLDLYIAGSLHSVGTMRIGDAASPSAFRLYVGGAELVALGSQIFNGAIYAPNAVISYTGSTIVRGGIFADQLNGLGSIQIDPARPVAPPPSSCAPPPVDAGNPPPTNPVPDPTPVIQ
jgi:hypothetical protein